MINKYRKSSLGNKEIMARNLQNYSAMMGKSQADLSRDLGYPATTVSEWFNALNYPRIDRIERMADYFGIEKSDLIEDHSMPQIKCVRIPVLGKVQAGIPVEAIQDIVDYEEISEDLSQTGEFFALKVRGESMEPKFTHGDVVIVRKQSNVESGQIGIVVVNGQDAAIKRIVRHDQGGISLISLNPSYSPLYFTNAEIQSLPVEIIGRVVELRAKF